MNFGATTPSSTQLPRIPQGYGGSYSLATSTRQAAGRGARDVQMGDGAARGTLLETRGVDSGYQVPSMPERMHAALNHPDDTALKLLFETDRNEFLGWMNNAAHAFLVKAALSDDASKMNFLLSKGADPDIQDAEGKTALLVAISRPSPLSEEMVDALLSKGADFTLRDNEGRSPLTLAARAENEQSSSDMFLRLLDQYDRSQINELDRYTGTTLLLDVIGAGASLKRVSALVHKGADVNLQDRGALWTPLICAVERGRSDLVKFLIDEGADVRIRDAQDRSPLMITYENLLEEQHEQAVKLLAARTSSHEVQRFIAESISQIDQVSRAYMEIASKLLKKIGGMNVPDDQGRTGQTDLHDMHAKRFRQPLPAELPTAQLLSQTAPLAVRHMRTAVDTNNAQLLADLQGQCSPEDFRALVNHPTEGFLMKASARHQSSMVKFLLRQGANPNAMDYSGRTPLFFAVANRSPEVVKSLLAAGANVQARGLLTLENALTRAVAEQRKERSEVLQRMLWRENLNLLSSEGWTALLNASVPSSNTLSSVLNHVHEIDMQYVQGRTALMDVIAVGGDRATVEHLLSRNPNVLLRDDHGRSAFDYAEDQPALLEALTIYLKGKSPQEYNRLWRESEMAFRERMTLLGFGSAGMSDFDA